MQSREIVQEEAETAVWPHFGIWGSFPSAREEAPVQATDYSARILALLGFTFAPGDLLLQQ